MKLNEKKEKLPITFITNEVSRGWDEVGLLNDEIKAITEQFSEAKAVADILQDLIDSYLVCIGRLENFLNNKDYVDLPDEKDLQENLKESIECTETVEAEQKDLNVDENNQSVKEEFTEAANNEIVEEEVEDNKESEAFEYFVDFDEPEPDDEADGVVKAWLNR